MILFTKRLYLLIFVSLFSFTSSLSAHGDDGGFPVICPQDVTVDCLSYTWDPADYGSPIPLNNGYTPTIVGPQISSTLNACGIGVIAKTWDIYTYHDHYTCTQKIHVVRSHGYSNTQPNITWPPNYTVNGCDADVSPENLPAPYNRPWVSNGTAPCGSMYAWTYKDWVFTPTTGGCKKILRDWTVIDWCTYETNNPHTGGIWTYRQEIVVMDNVLPTIACNYSVVASISGNSCEKGYVKIPVPSAFDNCGEVSVYHNSKYATASGSDASGYYPIGTTWVVFSAKDKCGNIQTCTTQVVVKDLIKPKVYCVAKLITTLMPDPHGNHMIQLVDNALDRGSEDNCTPRHQLTFRMEPNTFTCNNLGLNTVRMYVTDLSGNTDYCVSTIDVQSNMAVCPPDTIKPTIICPPYNTLSGFLHPDSCDRQFFKILDVTASDNRSNGLVVTHNSPYGIGSTTNATGVYPVGGTNVTFTATDAAGNASHCVIRVLIADTIKPLAKCKNATIYIGQTVGGIQAILTKDHINNGSSDNCLATLTYTLSKSNFSCNELGGHTVRMSINDLSNNADYCDATVSVVDTSNLCTASAPLITCPKDTMVLVPRDSCLGLFVQIPNATVLPDVGPVTITHSSIFAVQNGGNASGHYPIGLNNIIFTGVDTLGKSYTCKTQVTLLETTAPTANCKNGVILNLVQDSIQGGKIDLDPRLLNGFSSDNCTSSNNLTFIAHPASFNCNNLGINDVTLTVIDQSGNTDYCLTNVTITDSLEYCHLARMLSSGAMCPGNITINLPTGQCDGIELNLPNAFPRDFSQFEITHNMGRGSNVNAYFATGTTQVIYNINAMGSIYHCYQNIIVRENQAPIVNCRNGVTIPLVINTAITEMNIDPLLLNKNSTDNCTPPNSLQFWTEPATVNCAMLGSRPIKLFAKDLSGNSDYCTTKVLITDPEGICPGTRIVAENEVETFEKLAFETDQSTINPIEFKIKSKASSEYFSVYPNPFSEFINVNIKSEKENHGELRITDLTGKIIFKQRINIQKGTQSFILSKDKFRSAGMYFISLSADETIFQSKVLLME